MDFINDDNLNIIFIVLAIVFFILFFILFIFTYIYLKNLNKKNAQKDSNANSFETNFQLLQEKFNTIQKNIDEIKQKNNTFQTTNNVETKNLKLNFQSLQNKLHDSFENISKDISNIKEINQEKSKSLSEAFQDKFSSLGNDIKAINAYTNSNKDNLEKIFKNVENLKEITQSSTQRHQSVHKMIDGINKIFISNSQRGRLGEVSLRFILQNIFGTDNRIVEEQKVFDGLRPDFFLKFEDINIIIDSKFPYENFKTFIFEEQNLNLKKNKIDRLKKDLKIHISKMTDYNKNHKSSNHVIMFLPSQSLMDFIYENKEFSNILEMALKNEILIASPTTLPPILMIFAHYHENLKRVKNLKKIFASLDKLGENFKRFGERWEKFDKKVISFQKDTKDIDVSIRKITQHFEKIKQHDYRLLETSEKNKNPKN